MKSSLITSSSSSILSPSLWTHQDLTRISKLLLILCRFRPRSSSSSQQEQTVLHPRNGKSLNKKRIFFLFKGSCNHHHVLMSVTADSEDADVSRSGLCCFLKWIYFPLIQRSWISKGNKSAVTAAAWPTCCILLAVHTCWWLDLSFCVLWNLLGDDFVFLLDSWGFLGYF